MSQTFEFQYRTVLKEVGLAEYAVGALAKQFERLTELLTEWNRKTNLTAITDLEGILRRHFADSLLAAQFLPEGSQVIDVGTGGGFPSLPLALVRPDLQITALDSVEKKLEFVAYAAQVLSLRHLSCRVGRAEVLGRDPMFREQFDCAVSRAVARMDLLAELCLPLVRPGGSLVSLKGPEGPAELQQAAGAVRILGGSFEFPRCFSLGPVGERYLLICRKIAATPSIYPRSYARMKRKPL